MKQQELKEKGEEFVIHKVSYTRVDFLQEPLPMLEISITGVCLLTASHSGSSVETTMDTSHTASPPPSGKDISQHSSTVHPPPPAAFPPAANFRTGYNVGGKDPGGKFNSKRSV